MLRRVLPNGGEGSLEEVAAAETTPREDTDDIVSKESVPFSIELLAIGKGGGSEGANRPFLVVGVDGDGAEDRKRPLALGAEATRRMKRVMDFGESNGRELVAVVDEGEGEVPDF